MYIVARIRHINQARSRAAVAAAVEAGTRGSEIVGMPIFVWSTIFSIDGPAVSWSARVEHLADAIAADDTLFSDEAFAQWVEDNDGLFVGPTSDAIVQILHGAPTGPPKGYIQRTQAVCANGSMGEAMALGVELAETATRITGVPLMFVASVTGAYGEVGWVSGVDDLADFEAANVALATDEDWLKLVDRAGHAFAPGVNSTMLRRIG